MAAELPRPARPALVQALFDDPRFERLLDAYASDLPQSVGDWLGGLRRLVGLPFRTLVPDSRMLPMESIRFFFVDQNWLDALLDGALSVALSSSREKTILKVLRPHVQASAASASATAHARLRAATRGKDGAGDDSLSGPDTVPAATWTGFLLRSVSVADWPGLTVTAVDAACEALTPIRLDRLSPTVMLAIFDGVAGSFAITRPAQTLHFGFEDGEVVYLRGLGGPLRVGEQIGETKKATIRFRDAALGVLDVSCTREAIARALSEAYEDAPCPPVNPGAFGLELVAGAERQAFVPLAIGSFTADAPRIAAGGSSTLSWRVAGADRCSIDGRDVDREHDRLIVSPAQTTTYVLTATGGRRQATATATVEVA